MPRPYEDRGGSGPRIIYMDQMGRMTEDGEYLLGVGDDELARLEFQHLVWGALASRAWERAGFAPGHTILDVGCGPGHATLDLARLVTRAGRVHGVEISERFVAHLRREAE